MKIWISWYSHLKREFQKEKCVHLAWRSFALEARVYGMPRQRTSARCRLILFLNSFIISVTCDCPCLIISDGQSNENLTENEDANIVPDNASRPSVF